MLNQSPVEIVTALTDLMAALCCVFVIPRVPSQPSFKAMVWKWVFSMLGLAAVLGALTHGFAFPPEILFLLRRPMNLFLGLCIALFIVGTVIDLVHEQAARKVSPLMIAIGLGFFLMTIGIPHSFRFFLAYEVVAMLFALSSYIWLTMWKKLAGAGWMVGGIIVTIIAAAVQATGKAGTPLFWYFDNNGIFHLIQIIGIFLLARGLRSPKTDQPAISV